MPAIKHGFLRSEEDVLPAIFQHTKCVWENVFLYNFQYLCIVGVITIHVGRCSCLNFINIFIVADVIALADVIAIFCVISFVEAVVFYLNIEYVSCINKYR